MNITKHAKRRYVERILGITTRNEVLEYVAKNSERIEEYVKTLYEYADFIWKGQIGDNITRNYFLKDDIIIVTDTQNTAIITLYKVDYGFPEKTNLKIAKDLKSEIARLTNKYNKEIEKSKNKIDRKELELQNTELEIKSLENQIKLLKEKQDLLKNEIKCLKNNGQLINEEIKRNTILLVNSIDYKADLKELANK